MEILVLTIGWSAFGWLLFTGACVVAALAIFIGYSLCEHERCTRAYSELQEAIRADAVPLAAKQAVAFSMPPMQLLAIAQWKLKHQASDPAHKTKCRSIASRIMRC